MKAARVGRLGIERIAHTHHHLVPGDDCLDEGCTARFPRLRDGECRRDHCDPGVQRRFARHVIELEGMGGCTVQQRGRAREETFSDADAARPVGVRPSPDDGPHRSRRRFRRAADCDPEKAQRQLGGAGAHVDRQAVPRDVDAESRQGLRGRR